MSTRARTKKKADPSPVEAGRALAPRAREWADEAERERRAPAALVAALREAGLFRLCAPASLGGSELDVPTVVRTIEALSVGDASAGWIVMIGATSGIVPAYLPEESAGEIYGEGPDQIIGGVFAPRGRAQAEAGGYRVSGRWQFASGCEHSAWLLGGCLVFDGERPRLLPLGLPDSRMMLFPASEVSILDTWDTSGLRGTGSHDIEVRDRFVPESRSVSLVTDAPREPGPLYRFPVFGLLAVGVCAVSLGIARSAIDELSALARRKTPAFSRGTLAEKPSTWTSVARAEALLGSSRAFLMETVDEVWSATVADELRPEQRAVLRLAATNVARSCARAVDLMYDAGGGTSLYRESLLQRCFRDVHAVTQHAAVAPATLELSGRVLLGQDTDISML